MVDLIYGKSPRDRSKNVEQHARCQAACREIGQCALLHSCRPETFEVPDREHGSDAGGKVPHGVDDVVDRPIIAGAAY